jgi:hypothetical protein
VFEERALEAEEHIESVLVDESTTAVAMSRAKVFLERARSGLSKNMELTVQEYMHEVEAARDESNGRQDTAVVVEGEALAADAVTVDISTNNPTEEIRQR